MICGLSVKGDLIDWYPFDPPPFSSNTVYSVTNISHFGGILISWHNLAVTITWQYSMVIGLPFWRAGCPQDDALARPGTGRISDTPEKTLH